MSGVRVCIVGATGLVGRKFLECLERRNFPVRELRLLASERSEGRVLHFNGEPVRVQRLREAAADGMDVALFSAGSSVSREWAPKLAKRGVVVIDNSSAWRMDPRVPLVVPEVNPQDLPLHTGIIANPNCSTIQMVVALKPIHDRARVRRAVVSTYQAVSGAGQAALQELEEQILSHVTGSGQARVEAFPRPISFNAIPMIPGKNAFDEEGVSVEERKMMDETRKILGDPSIRVCATCVRIPVRIGHAEVLNLETEKSISPREAVAALRGAPGVEVAEDPERFPTPMECEGRDEVFVGRVRRDPSVENGLALWVVADNLLKGAALNAVQIAERLFTK